MKKDFKEGPKGLLTKLSEFKEGNSDQRRIRYLMKNFKYLQSKNARDYLMKGPAFPRPTKDTIEVLKRASTAN